MTSAIEAARAVGETVKHCNGCGRWLPLDGFARRRDRPSGRASRCKDCCNVRTRAWHALHPTYAHDYRKAHPEKLAASLRRQADKLDP
jgi:hypothetical protein